MCKLFFCYTCSIGLSTISSVRVHSFIWTLYSKKNKKNSTDKLCSVHCVHIPYTVTSCQFKAKRASFRQIGGRYFVPEPEPKTILLKKIKFLKYCSRYCFTLKGQYLIISNDPKSLFSHFLPFLALSCTHLSIPVLPILFNQGWGGVGRGGAPASNPRLNRVGRTNSRKRWLTKRVVR